MEGDIQVKTPNPEHQPQIAWVAVDVIGKLLGHFDKVREELPVDEPEGLELYTGPPRYPLH